MCKTTNLLLFLLLMPELEVLGEFIQVLAVVQLDLCSLPEEVLQFRHDGDLRFHADVQTSQLFVQLQPDICNATIALSQLLM